jgi:hypothetical protein
MKHLPERMVLLYIFCDVLYLWFLHGMSWLVLVGKVSTARLRMTYLAELHWIQQKSWPAKVRNQYSVLLTSYHDANIFTPQTGKYCQSTTH